MADTASMVLNELLRKAQLSEDWTFCGKARCSSGVAPSLSYV